MATNFDLKFSNSFYDDFSNIISYTVTNTDMVVRRMIYYKRNFDELL